MLDQQIKRMIRIRDPADPLEYVRKMANDLAYEKLCSAIESCKDCSIACGNKTFPSGRLDAPIVVISESACIEQLKDNHSYAQAGSKEKSIFDFFLERYGIAPDNFFYVNTVNCPPLRNTESGEMVPRTPSSQEVNNCRVFMDYALKIVQPKMLILLGAVALNVFKKGSISQERGEVFTVNNIPALATYHPDYFTKMAGKKDPDLIDECKLDFEEDLLKAFRHFEKIYKTTIIRKGEI